MAHASGFWLLVSWVGGGSATLGRRGSIVKSNVKNWLIDSAIVLVLTWTGDSLLGFVEVEFTSFLFRRSHTLLVLLADFFPCIIIGCFVGSIAACFIRHRKLFLALLPSVLICLIEVVPKALAYGEYPWFYLSWVSTFVGSWLCFIGASFLSGWFVLWRRCLTN